MITIYICVLQRIPSSVEDEKKILSSANFYHEILFDLSNNKVVLGV